MRVAIATRISARPVRETGGRGGTVRQAHPVAAIRAAEAALMVRLRPGALMQRAATGLASRCAGVLGGVYGRRVALIVGSGNNGGDALYAGAALARRGARVDAVLVGSTVHEGGLAALRRAGGRVAGDSGVLATADLVVDGVLGIGGRGGLREAAAEAAAAAAGGGAAVVSVDVPSGVDADTGRVDGVAVRADVTVTFGTGKPGLLVAPGAGYAGVVEVVDIGLGPYLPTADVAALDAHDVAALLPTPRPESDKYRRGVVGVAAGSTAYTGAAVLAVGGAVRGGAGMVRYVGDPRPAGLVRARWPEAVITDGTAEGIMEGTPERAGQVQAWVVGPGLGADAAAESVVRGVLASDVPVVVDADGPTVLTPHAGEFGRLQGLERAAVEADRLTQARLAARELGVTMLLKGSTTVVAAPDGRVRVNPTGTAALATAGSGDVLSGLCGALLAQGLEALDAAAVGAFLHGLAGRLAPFPTSASDLWEAWRAAVALVRNSPGD